MIKLLVAATIAVAVISGPAEARQKHRHLLSSRIAGLHPDCGLLFPCESPFASLFAPEKAPPMGRKTHQGQPAVGRNWFETAGRAIAHPVAGIVAPLAAKVSEIQSACGSRILSGVRHTLVAGTRRVSLHASGKAVDVAGNPSCIYAQLAGWPGGYSVDYGRVAHVHISYDEAGGREWGLHFSHGGGHRHRYARRGHSKMASAQ